MFESTPVITQETFVRDADSILAQANNPNVKFDETLQAAKLLGENLNLIEAKKLEVQPPLAPEQFTKYRENSNLLINLGTKAVNALNATEQTRDTGRRGRSKRGRGQSAKAPTYAGTGNSAKS
jgi:hypothetical protein